MRKYMQLISTIVVIISFYGIGHAQSPLVAPYIDFVKQGSAPANPTSTKERVYIDTSNNIHLLQNDGTNDTLVRANSAVVFSGVTIGSLSGILKASSGVVSGSATTDDLTEGATNKYFSNTLARGAISAGSGISYDSGTGVISASGSSGVTSITGTANQVLADVSTGAVTLSLPQSIATTSNVTFANIVSNPVGNNTVTFASSTGGANRFLVQDTSGNTGTGALMRVASVSTSTLKIFEWAAQGTLTGRIDKDGHWFLANNTQKIGFCLETSTPTTSSLGTNARFQIGAPATAVNDSFAVLSSSAGATSDTSLTVQAKASQTAPLLRLQTSGGSNIGSWSADGQQIVLGGTTSAGAKIAVGGTAIINLTDGAGNAVRTNSATLANGSDASATYRITDNEIKLGTSGVMAWTNSTIAGTTQISLARNGTLQSLQNTIFSQVGNLPITLATLKTNNAISNSNAKTDILGSGDTNVTNTRTIAASAFNIDGKVIRFNLSGYISTDAVTPGNLTIDIEFGTTTIITTGAKALIGSLTNAYWELSGTIRCDSTGASGTVIGQAKFIFDNALTPVILPLVATSATTLNLTNSHLFSPKLTFSVADTDNSITVTNMDLILMF